jgi:hypothetical protein
LIKNPVDLGSNAPFPAYPSHMTSFYSKNSILVRGLATVSLLVAVTASGFSAAQATTLKGATVVKGSASAAKIGGTCSTAGATTTVAGKSLTCTKALSGKLVWSASTNAAPSLGGGPNGGHDGGHDGGPGANPAFAAAMAKYTACLKAQGVTLPAFGGRRGFGGADDNNSAANRQKSASPAPRPTLSAKQQAAMTKCASLRPAFGRGFGGRGGGAGGMGAAGAGGFGGVANTPANVAAYIACLNTNGVNIAALSDLQGLDRQSPKIAAALAACRSKRVAQTPGN